MSNKIITFSREFGSGGRTIGKEVAAKLGIPCYDAELLEKIAEESGFAKEYVAEHGEYAAGRSWFSHAFSGRDYNGHSYQDDLWTLQQKFIRELAEKESCVIVGRCADYILKDTADCLRVFIHADMESRAKRIVEQYGERSESPEKRLRDKDKRRASYYQFYTNMKWGAVQNYHISLDSGALGIETCVNIIAELYRAQGGADICPGCGRHCPKDNLRCPKGKEHFGIQAEASESSHPEERPLRPGEKVLVLLRKCGHFLHHSAGPDTDPEALLETLTPEENASLEKLLEKCLESWQKLQK